MFANVTGGLLQHSHAYRVLDVQTLCGCYSQFIDVERGALLTAISGLLFDNAFFCAFIEKRKVLSTNFFRCVSVLFSYSGKQPVTQILNMRFGRPVSQSAALSITNPLGCTF